MIPVKKLDASKGRLGSVLSPPQRRSLSLAMLGDVLMNTDRWPDRWILTADPDAEAVGLSHGCGLIEDLGRGLNEELRRSMMHLGAIGASRVCFIPADVPLLCSDDLLKVMRSQADVTITPSSDAGTTALCIGGASNLVPMFGPHSASQHEQQARRLGYEVDIIDAGSLRLDIDDETDLAALAASSDDGRESVRVARLLLG